MPIRQFTLAIAVTACIMPFSAVAENAKTHTQAMGGVEIEQAWSRPTPPGAPMGVGYMTIRNHTDAAVRLTGANTPAAENVSLHETANHNGMMRMIALENGLSIGPGQRAELKPLSYHLMLEGLKQPLKVGDQIPVTLTFEQLPEQHTTLQVRSLDDMSGADGDHNPGDHSAMGH